MDGRTTSVKSRYFHFFSEKVKTTTCLVALSDVTEAIDDVFDVPVGAKNNLWRSRPLPIYSIECNQKFFILVYDNDYHYFKVIRCPLISACLKSSS